MSQIHGPALSCPPVFSILNRQNLQDKAEATEHDPDAAGQSDDGELSP